MTSAFELLGQPSSAAGDVFCYRSKDGKTFLTITRMVAAYDSKIAGAVTLSAFRNCTKQNVQLTPDDLAAWKTEKGIGLSSTSDDVRKAYGKPSREDSIEGDSYRWVIHGDYDQTHYSNQERPELGDRVLVYDGAADDLRVALFGIRRGKVAWIKLSKNE